MKNIHYSNTLFYFTIVGLYIFQPILGVLGQMGLGIFQFAVALNIMNVIKKANIIGHKNLRIYLFAVLIWFIIFLTFLFLEILRRYFITILYIIPMCIGLYFTVVTYLIYKNQKS